MTIKFPRGSVWRKWDLHVHTPASKLNNQFGDDWDIYVEKLFNKAIEKNIKVIGITDYFCISGYKKIKNDYLDNETKLRKIFCQEDIKKINTIKILPNIEFRLDKFVGGRRLNFHVILSDNISIKNIENNFLRDIKFVYSSDTKRVDEKFNLTIDNLKQLGNKLKEEHKPFRSKSDLKVGMENAVVNDNKIVEILNNKPSIFDGNYIIGIPVDEDLSKINWDGQDHQTRKVLIQKSHCIFSSNKNTREWALGEKHETKEQFIKEFKSLKPCIWYSDAHKFEELFKQTKNTYTWIKANPTFRGLKQVIYEPESRVKIQKNIPEAKSGYTVIDKVKFNDEDKRKVFPNNWLKLNPNLNVIIGGKSTGKSILLFLIAKTIDPLQVEKKFDDLNKDPFGFNDIFDFIVEWKNGDIDKLRNDKDDKKKQITYIPQMYINALVDNSRKIDDTLHNLILEILKQNIEFKQNYNKISLEIKELKTNIDKRITDLFNYIDDKNQIKQKIKKLGDKDAIKEEIKNINKKINNLKTKSDFTEEETKNYHSLEDRKNELEKKSNNLDKDIEKVEFLRKETSENINSNLSSLLNIYNENLKNISINEHQEKLQNIKKELKDKLEQLLKEADDQFNKLLKTMNSDKKNISKELNSINNKLTPYNNKIENQELLKELNDNLTEQKNILKKISEKEEKLKIINTKLQKEKDKIIEKYKKLKDKYYEIKNIIKDDFKYITEDIELITNIYFNNKDFDQYFTDLFDRRKSKFDDKYNFFNESELFIYNKEKHIENMELLLNNILDQSKEFPLKSNSEIKDTIQKLFLDYFEINFDLVYEGDKIYDMSPGKSGIVLLQLYLQLSNETHPILIDQPEDNLDNRTIFNNLVEFIKSKKVKRQIVIITHNANLVVPTDAEEIIVANQDIKENKQYQFEYISGPIENSFKNKNNDGILFKYGIREHTCEILEGGQVAFQKREKKYEFN